MFVTFIVGRPSPPPSHKFLLPAYYCRRHRHCRHHHHPIMFITTNTTTTINHHTIIIFSYCCLFSLLGPIILLGVHLKHKNHGPLPLSHDYGKEMFSKRDARTEVLFHSIKLPPSFRNSRQLGFHDVKINSRFRLLPENALKLGKTTSLELFPDNNPSQLFPMLSP